MPKMNYFKYQINQHLKQMNWKHWKTQQIIFNAYKKHTKKEGIEKIITEDKVKERNAWRNGSKKLQ